MARIKSLWNVLIFMSLSMGLSCSNESVVDVSEKDTIKFLALGDSYTIGSGIDPKDNWPNQLKRELLSLDYPVDTLSIIARIGYTTQDLLNRINNSEIGEFNLVTLQIGVNNQYQGLPFEQFKNQFKELLMIAIDISKDKNRVLVLTIPDYGVTPFAESNREKIAEEIDRYNNYIKTMCKDAGILCIDITQISRNLANNPVALAPDELHPSAYQYRLWVESFIDEVILMIDSMATL